MYQVRSGGLLKEYQDLTEALAHEGGKWDKVSWTTQDGRLILFSDGTWEHRTAESLRKLVGFQ